MKFAAKTALLSALLASAASAQTIENTPVGTIGSFGYPDSQTYGQVFTAPSDVLLNSFTLYLDSDVGPVLGGVGTWNGTETWAAGYGSPTNLYLSDPTAFTTGGAFTFSPNVILTGGNLYVAYLTVYGVPGASLTTTMPTGSSVTGLNYFVWHNSTAGDVADPIANPSWNYFGNFGNALFSAVFGPARYYLNFDGADTAGDGIIQGGAGTWDGTTTNWTTDDGLYNGAYVNSLTNSIIFGGAAGGDIDVVGLRRFGTLNFSTSGYVLGGTGSLEIDAGTINVADLVSATINTTITGVNGLSKTGLGELILGGANTYSGGTAINAGRLVITHNQALSDGVVSIAGGATLAAGVDGLAIENDVNLLAGAANIDAGAGAFALNGIVSGVGALNKIGAGELILTGANTYAGGTNLSEGTITVAHNDALGTGGLVMSDGTTLRAGAADLALANNVGISGAATVDTGAQLFTLDGIIADASGATGSLTKVGSGTLVLTGANTYSGGTTVTAGLLKGNTTSLQGAIVNNARVEFNQATAGTYAGVMSGTGSLTKTGAGTLTLTGANTYSGGTTVTAGRLTGNSTSLQGTIVNNAQVEFNQSTAGTYAGVMSGTGSLTKTGTGTLTLTGANTYSGGTTVTAGRLTGNSTSLQGTIVNNAQVEFNQSTAGTYAGVMSGTGSLIKTGAATLTLTGANTYSGGTTVTAGRLAGNTTSLQGAIANNAEVEFNQATAGTYAGVMSGTGSLIKTGTGTLTLTGANTYSGGTMVSAGTLVGNATSLQGDIVNNAEVEFNQTTAGTYDGAMSGTGSLTKTGAGTLTLTGANTYSGGTTVTAGRLTGNSTSLQGAIVNNAQVEFNQATAGTYAGVMSGTGSLTKTEAGDLTLTGANTYSGGTNLSEGAITVANNAALGTGSLAMSEGTALRAGGDGLVVSNNISLNTSGTVDTGANTFTLAGIISDATTQVLSYVGSWQVDQGPSWSGSPPNGPLAYTGQEAAALLFGGNAADYQISTAGADLASINNLSWYSIIGYGAEAFAEDYASKYLGLYYGPTSGYGFTINEAASAYVSDNASGAAYTNYAFALGTVTLPSELVKTGTGTLILSGANTYSGGTRLTAGTIQVNNGSALGTGGLVMSDGTTLRAGAADLALANNVGISGAATVDTGAQLFTLDGIIADASGATGSLTKVGSGTLVLTGANTYSGGTTVTAGLLKGNTTSLQGAIVNNARVEFNQATAGTYAGVMSGTGSLTKTGAGTLTLTGANTYSGGTTVTAGRLTGNSTSLQGTIVNNAQVEFNQSTAGTYAGVMSGTGSLTKTGTGTLTLTGANTYSGGTTVTAGRLTGNSTSLQGTIVNNAQVEFNQSTAGTYAGVMSGTGSLIKTGAATLTLTGANTYSGGTTVTAGRLAGNTTSLQGAIANNAEVEFNQATAGTYAGVMSGTGSLIKTGTGTLTLTGTSAISGQASIQAGTLNVAQQLSTGGLFVRSGGTLAGSGTVVGNVTVESGGTLAPGNSPGTLSVAGNVTFSAGSTFAAEIDGATYNAAGGAGSYDRLVVSGTATLGGTIAPILRGITAPANNNYTPNIGDTITLITANNVVGNFSSVLQPTGLAANTRLDLLYSSNGVRLAATPGSFAALGVSDGWRQNAINAATGLDGVRPTAGTRSGNLQSLYNGLYGLNRQQLNTTVTQLSGEIYANALQSQVQAERSTLAAVLAASCNLGCQSGSENTPGAIWMSYVGDYSSPSSDAFSSGYKNSNQGLAIGATVYNNGKLQLGFAGSYVENEVVSIMGARAKSPSVAAYAYTHYLPSDKVKLSAAIGLSKAETSVTRTVATATGPVSAASEKKSTGLMLNAAASYRFFENGPLTLWSDAGIELSDTSMNSLRESASNADYALAVGRAGHASLQTRLGARLELNSDNLQITTSANWLHELADNPAGHREISLGDADWTVTSVHARRDGFRLGIQGGLRLSGKASLFAGYQYTDHGSGYSYGRANAGVKMAF